MSRGRRWCYGEVAGFSSILMGLYSRYIFPRLCERMMGDPRMTALRHDLLAEVGGDILEIGFGTGLNLNHYPPHVEKLTTIDPNPGMSKLARRRISGSSIAVDERTFGSEELPFGDECFDCVVSTWTLCSIPDADRALAEIHRVLRPGGRFLFLEHGLSDDTGVQKWQRRLNPLQRVIGDGCRLDLDVEAVVGRQPFGGIEMERFVIEQVPRTHGSMYRGVATK